MPDGPDSPFDIRCSAGGRLWKSSCKNCFYLSSVYYVSIIRSLIIIMIMFLCIVIPFQLHSFENHDAIMNCEPITPLRWKLVSARWSSLHYRYYTWIKISHGDSWIRHWIEYKYHSDITNRLLHSLTHDYCDRGIFSE